MREWEKAILREKDEENQEGEEVTVENKTCCRGKNSVLPDRQDENQCKKKSLYNLSSVTP